MKVSILGTEYQVNHSTLKEDSYLNNIDGYTDNHNKVITYRHYVEEDRNENTIWPLIENENKALRHELIHAFLFESGLSVNSNNIKEWATNEEMVDWMAIQMPKIMEAYQSIVKPKRTIETHYIGGHIKITELPDVPSHVNIPGCTIRPFYKNSE